MPQKISKKAALNQINDLIKLLKGHNLNLPCKEYSDNTLSAIDKIANILNLSIKPHSNQIPIAKDNFTKSKSQPKLPRVNKTRYTKEPNASISSINPPNNPNININSAKFTTNTMPIPKYVHNYNTRSKDTSKLSQIN